MVECGLRLCQFGGGKIRGDGEGFVILALLVQRERAGDGDGGVARVLVEKPLGLAVRAAILGVHEERVKGVVVAKLGGFCIGTHAEPGELLELLGIGEFNGDGPQRLDHPAGAVRRIHQPPHHFLSALLPAPTDGKTRYPFEALGGIRTAARRGKAVLPLQGRLIGIAQFFEIPREECAAQVVAFTP